MLRSYFMEQSTYFSSMDKTNEGTRSFFELQEAYEKLLKEKEDWMKERADFQQQIDLLNDRVKQLLQERYGPKSEKLKTGENPNPDEPSFFDEANLTPAEQAELDLQEETITVNSYSRGKPKRKPLPAHLPREQVLHDLAPGEKVCVCGHALHCIGEEKSEQLEFTPAVIKVLEHVRPKYACKACQEGVKIAPVPVQVIPKSIATPGLLAHVLCCKFEDHLPLYRQERIWQRLGVDLPRATLCNWVLKCAELCVPLVQLLKAELLQWHYLHADETSVQVLKEEGKTATSKSYIWVYMTGGVTKPIVVYEYEPGRSGSFPKEFLENFKGYLQTDAYGGYNPLRARPEVTVLGCMAHVRRKFAEIVKRTAKESSKAQVAVNFIAKLYAIEKQAREQKLDFEAIFKLRQEKAKPILERFKAWLDDLAPRVPPQNALGKAIVYALNQWNSLMIYLEKGFLNIDNNPVENKIRPFALGRRNWLFMGNARGADAAATLFSLLESAKANGLEGYYYFRHILTRLPHCKTQEELLALLPHHCDPAEVGQLPSG